MTVNSSKKIPPISKLPVFIHLAKVQPKASRTRQIALSPRHIVDSFTAKFSISKKNLEQACIFDLPRKAYSKEQGENRLS